MTEAVRHEQPATRLTGFNPGPLDGCSSLFPQREEMDRNQLAEIYTVRIFLGDNYLGEICLFLFWECLLLVISYHSLLMEFLKISNSPLYKDPKSNSSCFLTCHRLRKRGDVDKTDPQGC
jgi:hypothetical protein